MTITEVPTCPSCKKEHTLVVSDDMRITCTRDAGGCGMNYYIDDFPRLYVKKEQED